MRDPQRRPQPPFPGGRLVSAAWLAVGVACFVLGAVAWLVETEAFPSARNSYLIVAVFGLMCVVAGWSHYRVASAFPPLGCTVGLVLVLYGLSALLLSHGHVPVAVSVALVVLGFVAVWLAFAARVSRGDEA